MKLFEAGDDIAADFIVALSSNIPTNGQQISKMFCLDVLPVQDTDRKR